MASPEPDAPAKLHRRGRIALTILLLILASAIAAVLLLVPQPAGSAEGQNLTGSFGASTSQPSPPGLRHRGLRLGTFNIDGGVGADGRTDLARTASCLQRLDFIALNEVHGFGGTHPTNQAATLGALLQLPYLFAPAERRFGHDSFGNAVLTNLRLTRWQRVMLPSQPFHARRNYVLSDVVWRGMSIHLLTTHIDWRAGGDEQLRIVSQQFLHLQPPAVLMGDLNHPPSSPQIRQLLATPGVGEAIRSIFPEDDHPRVDWIFLRGLRAIDAGIVDLGASDHPAYWAEVVPLQNPPPATMSEERPR